MVPRDPCREVVSCLNSSHNSSNLSTHFHKRWLIQMGKLWKDSRRHRAIRPESIHLSRGIRDSVTSEMRSSRILNISSGWTRHFQPIWWPWAKLKAVALEARVEAPVDAQARRIKSIRWPTIMVIKFCATSIRLQTKMPGLLTAMSSKCTIFSSLSTLTSKIACLWIKSSTSGQLAI